MGVLRTLDDITGIVIHCSDTPNGRDDKTKDIDRWHGERGFKRNLSLAPNHQPHLKNIGYHYVVELDGTIVPGRPLIETGAHVRGHNLDTVGICLIGRGQYTSDQWLSLYALITTLQATLPNAKDLYGHYELDSGKTCPLFNVDEYIKNGYRPLPENILTLEGAK